MRFLFVVLFAALLIPAAANAAQQCYNEEQLEAEQGIRIHSELMTIALNCQHLAGSGVQLFRQYEDFTRNNVGLIEKYENTMRSFYVSEGKNGETELNTFRTMMANRIANEAVRLQPNVFCRAYGGRITQASAMSRDQFRVWARTVFPGYPITRPLCQGVSVPTQSAPAGK